MCDWDFSAFTSICFSVNQSVFEILECHIIIQVIKYESKKDLVCYKKIMHSPSVSSISLISAVIRLIRSFSLYSILPNPAMWCWFCSKKQVPWKSFSFHCCRKLAVALTIASNHFNYYQFIIPCTQENKKWRMIAIFCNSYSISSVLFFCVSKNESIFIILSIFD